MPTDDNQTIFELLHQIIQCSNRLAEIEPEDNDDDIADCTEDGSRLVEALLAAITAKQPI